MIVGNGLFRPNCLRTMNAKQINLVLWSAAGVASTAAIASLALGVLLPLQKVESTQFHAAVPASRPTAIAGVPPASAFEKIWGMSLRQPLGDAPPSVPTPPVANVVVPVPAPASGLPVSLVGTIGTSIAMLKSANNAVEVCAVGESLNGVTVVAVRQAEVDVRFNGQIVKLSKPTDSP